MNTIISNLKKSLPRYNTKQPSTEKLLTYRPFTVKEEKALLLSKNTGSYSDFLSTIANVVEECYSDNNINAKKMSIFDVEYLFLKLREKSVSEIVNVSFTCPYTKEKIKNVEIRLDKIEIKKIDNPKQIKLADNLVLNMRYPTFEFLIESTQSSSDGNVDLFDMVLHSIESIQTPDEIITSKDLTKENLNEFIDNLTRQQYEKILDFHTKIPKIEYEIKYITQDAVVRSIVFKGLRDFFR